MVVFIKFIEEELDNYLFLTGFLRAIQKHAVLLDSPIVLLNLFQDLSSAEEMLKRVQHVAIHAVILNLFQDLSRVKDILKARPSVEEMLKRVQHDGDFLGCRHINKTKP